MRSEAYKGLWGAWVCRLGEDPGADLVEVEVGWERLGFVGGDDGGSLCGSRAREVRLGWLIHQTGLVFSGE